MLPKPISLQERSLKPPGAVFEANLASNWSQVGLHKRPRAYKGSLRQSLERSKGVSNSLSEPSWRSYGFQVASKSPREASRKLYWTLRGTIFDLTGGAILDPSGASFRASRGIFSPASGCARQGRKGLNHDHAETAAPATSATPHRQAHKQEAIFNAWAGGMHEASKSVCFFFWHVCFFLLRNCTVR